MKFLLDENIGMSVFDFLKNIGYDVIFIGSNLSGVKDESILEKAYREKRILITLDQDFGSLVFRKLMPHCGVILLKPRQDSVQTRINLIDQLLKKFKKYLSGKFIVISEAKIRRR